MEKHSHDNFKQCYPNQVSRGRDLNGNSRFDRFEANEKDEPYEMPYDHDSYGNARYEDKDDYGNYKCDEEE